MYNTIVHDARGVAQVCGLKKSGEAWRGPCPCCRKGGPADDGLAVFDGNRGSVIFYCHHANCTATHKDLQRALQREHRFDLSRSWVGADGRRISRTDMANGEKSRPRHDYGRKTTGLPLSFHYDGGGSVIIPEGESDADALVAWVSANSPDFAVAVYTGGANKAGDADYSAVLGRDTIHWPDNDEAGVQAGAKSAAAAWHAGANSVRIVEPFGASGAGAADATTAEILAALCDAVPWIPPESVSETIPATGVPAYLGADSEGDAWRMIESHGQLLMLATRDCEGKGDRSVPHVMLENGQWLNSPELLDEIYQSSVKASRRRVKALLEEMKQREGEHFEAARDCLIYLRRRGTKSQAARREAVELLRAADIAIGKEGAPDAQRLLIAKHSELDADARYLGTPDGVVDLRDGRVLPPEEGRLKLVTRNTGVRYRPEARGSNKYINELLGQLPAEDAEYMLDCCAYALHGRPRTWHLLEGPARSGKSTFLLAVATALGLSASGGYGGVLPQGALLEEKYRAGGSPSPHLQIMLSARFVYSSELPQGVSRFNAGLIKALTGGEGFSVRGLYERYSVERPVSATIFQAVNPGDATRLSLTDPALEARTRLVPWTGFPEGTKLEENRQSMVVTLEASEALLSELIQRCQHLMETPAPPQSVVQAVEDKRLEGLGDLGLWFQDNIKEQPHVALPGGDIWAAAAKAFGESGDTTVQGFTRHQFFVFLRMCMPHLPRQVVMTVNGKNQRGFRGFRLAKPQDGPPPDAASRSNRRPPAAPAQRAAAPKSRAVRVARPAKPPAPPVPAVSVEPPDLAIPPDPGLDPAPDLSSVPASSPLPVDGGVLAPTAQTPQEWCDDPRCGYCYPPDCHRPDLAGTSLRTPEGGVLAHTAAACVACHGPMPDKCQA